MRAQQLEKIRELLSKPDQIRNMSVIAHVDHGKTTLTDSLLARAGIISENSAGKACSMDTDPKEQEMGITIKSTGVSLWYENPITREETLVNLIDSPGHIDFSGEVTAALRVTDGALVVVDAVEGVAVQTETVLRQACAEKIRPVLVINKLDRLLGELKDDSESIYRRMVNIIAKVNSIISAHRNESLQIDGSSQDYELDPSLGNVAFASGKQCWGFTLRTFARMYNSRFNLSEDKIMKNLWGEHYFDASTKVIRTEYSSTAPRMFCEWVLKPLTYFYNCVSTTNLSELPRLVEKLGLQKALPPAEIERLKDAETQERISKCMRAWLPLADSIFQMIQTHLPSPKQAMVYRAKHLYDGPYDDENCIAMEKCDANGPLMMYVSKMIPNADYSRFYAFGRVFSGTISTGQKVRVQGPEYKQSGKHDLFMKSVQKLSLMMGKTQETVDSVPAGGIVMILGVDTAIVKTGTITSSASACNIKSMKYSVSPIMRVAVSTPQLNELQRLLDGLKVLQKYDPLVQIEIDENTGQHVISCGGELHMKVCIDKLHEFTGSAIPIVVSQPTVSYRESVSAKSKDACLSKTPNKLNRLYATCEPLGEELTNAIEDGAFSVSDVAINVSKLVEEFSWMREDAKRIWCFGPEDKDSPTNCLVNCTQGVQNLQAIQQSIVTSFNWCVKEGLMCEEPLRGVRFNLDDANIHADPAHYRDNQIIPAARRLFKAAQYVSEPIILEPFYLVEISTMQEQVGKIHAVLNRRKGVLIDENFSDSNTSILQAYLPVSASFGFDSELKTETKGKALASFKFDHWEPLRGSVFDPTSKAAAVVAEIRKRKGLEVKLPELASYLDKL